MTEQLRKHKVDDNKKLREWVGLYNIDREGKPCNVVGCSCVVVKDYDNDIVKEYLKCKKWTNNDPDPS